MTWRWIWKMGRPFSRKRLHQPPSFSASLDSSDFLKWSYWSPSLANVRDREKKEKHCCRRFTSLIDLISNFTFNSFQFRLTHYKIWSQSDLEIIKLNPISNWHRWKVELPHSHRWHHSILHSPPCSKSASISSTPSSDPSGTCTSTSLRCVSPFLCTGFNIVSIVRYYLPPIDCVNKDFLKQILAN